MKKDGNGFFFVFLDPPFCESSQTYCYDDQVIPPGCERGDSEGLLTLTTEGSVIFFWITIITCMVSILLKVVKMERKLGKYAVRQPSFARSKETAYRGLFYIGAFWITFFPITTLLAVTRNAQWALNHKGFVLAMALLSKLTAPLIGFFHTLILFRKRFAMCLKPRNSLAWIPQIPYVGPWVVQMANRPSKKKMTTRARPDKAEIPAPLSN